MKNKVLLLLAIFLSSGLLSCGGGSGSGIPFFGGVWSGTLRLVEDSCGRGIVSFAFFNHLVNQDEFQLVLDNGATTFTGTLQSDTSFSVSTKRSFPPASAGESCTETLVWRYEAIDESNDSADFIVRRSDITCVRGETTNSCAFAFSGSGRRGSRDEFGPIPVSIPEDLELDVPTGAVNAADL